jgi:hypothetical protein
MFETIEQLRPVIFWIMLCMGSSLFTGGLLLSVALRGIGRLDIPEGADFTTALRHVPFLLVVALDLLDFGLDFLAAPVIWFFLSRTDLRVLRNVSVVQAVIPFTQPVPVLTLAWIGVNKLGLHF